MVIVVVNFAGQLRFFVRAAVGLIIRGAISIEREVAVDFFKLFL